MTRAEIVAWSAEAGRRIEAGEAPVCFTHKQRLHLAALKRKEPPRDRQSAEGHAPRWWERVKIALGA
jgi:hypothetical protein